jgi:hypothetical protein
MYFTAQTMCHTSKCSKSCHVLAHHTSSCLNELELSYFLVGYFATPSELGLYSVESYDEWWIMNWKVLEGSGTSIIKVLPRNLIEGTEKNHKNSLRIAGVPGEIRTNEYLPLLLHLSSVCHPVTVAVCVSGNRTVAEWYACFRTSLLQLLARI